MKDQTLADLVEGGNVVAPPGSAAASSSEGFSGSGSSPGAMSVEMKTVRIFSDRIRDRIHLEEFRSIRIRVRIFNI